MPKFKSVEILALIPTFATLNVFVAVRVSPPESVKSAMIVKVYSAGECLIVANSFGAIDFGIKLILKLPSVPTSLLPEAIMLSSIGTP